MGQQHDVEFGRRAYHREPYHLVSYLFISVLFSCASNRLDQAGADASPIQSEHNYHGAVTNIDRDRTML